MNIAILGYGRMGKEIEHQAKMRGHHLAAVFDINDKFSVDSNCNGAQVLISFVSADAVIGNIRTAAQLGLPIIEGTTGWYDRLDQLEQISNIAVLYSPNFSMGVYQFTKLARYAAELFGKLPEYDCYVHEFHHIGKADSPSGTAKSLANVLLENLPNKQRAQFETSHGVIAPEALHVTSTRVGRVPGTHEIGFDSSADEIVLRHAAHGREGLALGALSAAEWLIGKRGIFTMDDFMNDLIRAD
jgi:4-hydroxy-tetrahydrodipicolinate reductase